MRHLKGIGAGYAKVCERRLRKLLQLPGRTSYPVNSILVRERDFDSQSYSHIVSASTAHEHQPVTGRQQGNGLHWNLAHTVWLARIVLAPMGDSSLDAHECD